MRIAQILSAAQRFIQIDDGEELITLSLCKLIFGRKQQPFGFEHLEVTCSSNLVTEEHMTHAFQQHLDAVASHVGGGFVSSCYGPQKGDMAILVVPLGADTGTLTLLTRREVYNGAGISLKHEKVTIIEGGGGEWSLRKLQFFATSLASANFKLKTGNKLRGIADEQPTEACRSFNALRK